VIDTSDSDNENGLRFRWDVERVFRSGLSAKVDEFLSLVSVVLVEFTTSLSVFFLSSLASLLSVCQESLSGLSQLGVSGSLLGDVLGDVLFTFLSFH